MASALSKSDNGGLDCRIVRSGFPKRVGRKPSIEMRLIESLPTPTLLLDRDRTAANIERMQAVCRAHDVALWPHVKTHKMAPVAQMQLAAGAVGITCAKLGEAEALLPSGVRRVFVAYPLVDRAQAPRIAALGDALEELLVAVTSMPQAEALEDVLSAAGVKLPVMMALDTGLHREGARGIADAQSLAALIDRLPHMQLTGLFTHEGHAYSTDDVGSVVRDAHARMIEIRDAIDPSLPLWPGSSLTAAEMATLAGVSAVRPGAYVFGDLALADVAKTMAWDDLALTVATTVVDRPEPGLALIDAGSKTLFADRVPDGRVAAAQNSPALTVRRLSEEHGFLTGEGVDELSVRDKLTLVPAHVCPVVNLADEVTVVSAGEVVDTWRVAARGKVR